MLDCLERVHKLPTDQRTLFVEFLEEWDYFEPPKNLCHLEPTDQVLSASNNEGNTFEVSPFPSTNSQSCAPGALSGAGKLQDKALPASRT